MHAKQTTLSLSDGTQCIFILADALPALLRAMRQEAQTATDAGAIEYDSWRNAGAIEYDSWRNAL